MASEDELGIGSLTEDEAAAATRRFWLLVTSGNWSWLSLVDDNASSSGEMTTATKGSFGVMAPRFPT